MASHPHPTRPPSVDSSLERGSFSCGLASAGSLRRSDVCDRIGGGSSGSWICSDIAFRRSSFSMFQLHFLGFSGPKVYYLRKFPPSRRHGLQHPKGEVFTP